MPNKCSKVSIVIFLSFQSYAPKYAPKEIDKLVVSNAWLL